MLIAALCSLGAAAVAGLFLAIRHFLRKRLPVWVALLHGLGGAVGFTLVLLVVVNQPAFQLARQALYLFIVTIALGSVNLLFHVRGVRHRTSLIATHALCAVSGVVTLILAVASPEASAGQSEPSATRNATASASAKAQPAPPPVESATPSPSVAATAPAAPAASNSGVVAKASELIADAAARRILGQSIAFASNGTAPLSGSTLAAFAKVLRDHPEILLVEVQGHADERGEDGHNLEVTRARATAVIDALVTQGVARDRLRGAGYGARCPADPACRGANPPESCHAAERWQSDRRVVFVPLKVGTRSLQGELVCEAAAELIPPEDREFHVAP